MLLDHFVSSITSPTAPIRLTGFCHLFFQLASAALIHYVNISTFPEVR